MIDNFLIMRKLKGFVLLLSVFIFIGCGSDKTNIEAETYFIKKVQLEMENSIEFETDFTNLVQFKWDEVCFTDDSSLLLKFNYLKTNTQHTILLPKNYNIQEDYVKGSQIQSNYKNNCWKKGTTFIIKKWNTIKKDDLLIQIKGV